MEVKFSGVAFHVTTLIVYIAVLYAPCKDKKRYDGGSRPMIAAAKLKMGGGNWRRAIIWNDDHGVWW